MSSGIYMYTFRDGSRYVGQAVDINNRWAQHIDKMQRGKHTRLIQAAYNKYSLPKFEVLIECHPHYLDWIEAVYINNLTPELNTTIPRLFVSANVSIKLYTTFIQRPLSEISEEWAALITAVENKDNELVEAYASIEDLQDRVLEVAIENSPHEVRAKILDLYFVNSNLRGETERLGKALQDNELRIYEYNLKPWYQRIWSKV